MRLDKFDNRSLDRGRPAWVEALWLVVQWLFVSSCIPGSRHRVFLLRVFGATIGYGVTAKPYLSVKFPWKLITGNHVWLGERVWIDNLARVTIGSHVCISQGAYLCTGSHDWTAEAFELVTKPIEIEDHAWVCARTAVGPGVKIGEGAVLSLGSIATKALQPWHIHVGNPAERNRARIVAIDRRTDRPDVA